MTTLLLGIAGCALLFAFTALLPLRTEEGGCGACHGDGAGGCGLRSGSDGRCPLEQLTGSHASRAGREDPWTEER